MKTLLLVLSIAISSLPVLAQQEGAPAMQQAPSPAVPMAPGQPAPPIGPKAQITFKEASFDFGTIKQGEKIEHVFEYTNTGQAPLIISNIQTTCGCTASKWVKTPVAPGKTGQVTVTFNSAGKSGRQNKVVTVFSNAVNPEERIAIVTNVETPGVESTK